MIRRATEADAAAVAGVHRRARELLDFVAQDRRRGGDLALVLWAWAENPGARLFYERRGWVVDAEAGEDRERELRYRLTL